jgi:hypothetical protein
MPSPQLLIYTLHEEGKINMGYLVENKLLGGLSQVLGAGVDVAVSESFRMSAADSLNFVARVTAADFTVGAGITATIEESFDGTNWVATGKSVAITAAGIFEMSLNADDTEIPLAPQCRVTVVTTAGSAVTITAVHITRRY